MTGAQQGGNGFLYIICILVFVNHYFCIILSKFQGSYGRKQLSSGWCKAASFLINQKGQGIVLCVTEFQNTFLLLLLHVSVVKILCQPGKDTDKGSGSPHLRNPGLFRDREERLK